MYKVGVAENGLPHHITHAVLVVRTDANLADVSH